MHFISTKGKHHCIQIAFPTSPPKHLYNPLLERLLRERSSTCLLLLLHIPTLTNGNCEVDSFQITKLIKKYVSFSFSFVSSFPNFFLPLPVCPRMITSRIDHRRKKKSEKKSQLKCRYTCKMCALRGSEATSTFLPDSQSIFSVAASCLEQRPSVS